MDLIRKLPTLGQIVPLQWRGYTRYTNVGPGSGDHREGKGPRWSLKSRTNLSPSKLSLSVQVHAAGCWQKPKTGFHKTHDPPPPIPFLSIPYLFAPFFPLPFQGERDTRLFSSSRSLSLSFFRLFLRLFFTLTVSVRARSRMRHPTRPHRVTLTSIQINRT